MTDAADGPSADAALACGGFACAVLDNRMPEPTGVQVAAAARARGDATPILIVSGSITSDDLAAVSPPTYLLGKPFEFTALVALVDRFVERGVADRSVTDTPRPSRRGWLRWFPR